MFQHFHVIAISSFPSSLDFRTSPRFQGKNASSTMGKCAFSNPIGSMYGIFARIWLILNFMVNVGKYTVHGLFGNGRIDSKYDRVPTLWVP